LSGKNKLSKGKKMYKVTYEIQTEDADGNAIWEEVTMNVRDWSQQHAIDEMHYHLVVERGATIRNLRAG